MNRLSRVLLVLAFVFFTTSVYAEMVQEGSGDYLGGKKMNTDTAIDQMLNEHQIRNLLIRWGHARDSEDWSTLAECFHDDATIHLSWISGSANDFIAASKTMSINRKPGTHMKHVISGPWIRVHKNRAFSRCHSHILIRINLDGYEFDLQSWLQFYDLLEFKNESWRIVKRTAVYEKDRLDLVNPMGNSKDLSADMDLSAFPESAKFLCYMIQKSGGAPSDNIITVYSKEEQLLKEESEKWLKD
jgi:3-phenylpropionate/cinnamic acid dioxygenase small subunit